MHAAVYDQTGGPEVLRYDTVPDPDVSGDGVVVRVEAISVEGGDTLHRARGPLDRTPHIVGYQCAGMVIAVGEDVTSIGQGDRVVTVGPDGSHAELRAVPESLCWPIPSALSTEQAACVPVAFGTAHDALFEFGRLRPGETVLVQAGASGVGIAAVQLAKRVGARVLATASRDEKLARLSALGLDEGINYATRDVVAEVQRLTGGRGVDLVLDTVGGSQLACSVQSLGYRGRCVSIGDAGRQAAAPVDLAVLRPKNQTVSGYFLGAELLFGHARVHPIIATLLDEVAAGDLRVVIDRRFPLSQAAAAHAYIESRQAFGRVLLIP